MAIQCPYCSTQLHDQRSLNKHLKNIHNIFPDILTFCCFHCSEIVRSLPTPRIHSYISHQQPFLKVCYICLVSFQTKLEYAEQVNNEHSMPTLYMEEDEIDSSRPTVRSISGGLNYYKFQQGEKIFDIWNTCSESVMKYSELSTNTQKHFPNCFN